MARRELILAVGAALISIGCGSNLDLILECPSSGRSLTAYAFIESGGGAAGWLAYAITMQPGNQPLTPPAHGLFGAPNQSETVFRASHLDGLILSWDGSEQLTVSAAGESTVFDQLDQYPAAGRPRARIKHTTYVAEQPEPPMPPPFHVTCRSGDLVVTDPSERHLR